MNKFKSKSQRRSAQKKAERGRDNRTVRRVENALLGLPPPGALDIERGRAIERAIKGAPANRALIAASRKQLEDTFKTLHNEPHELKQHKMFMDTQIWDDIKKWSEEENDHRDDSAAGRRLLQHGDGEGVARPEGPEDGG